MRHARCQMTHPLWIPESGKATERCQGANTRGPAGLASGLTMSAVAAARSVCCRVLSPMCSFSPNSTRLSVAFALANKFELSYLVCEPWYFANRENGAVGNRHSAFAPHVQVWKSAEGTPESKSMMPLAY